MAAGNSETTWCSIISRTRKMKKYMETIIIIAAWICIAIILWQLFSFTPKKNNNEKNAKRWQKSQTYQKKSKLLRFQRGNKTLNPDQQKELERISNSNFRILKQMWKDEHL